MSDFALFGRTDSRFDILFDILQQHISYYLHKAWYIIMSAIIQDLHNSILLKNPTKLQDKGGPTYITILLLLLVF